MDEILVQIRPAVYGKDGLVIEDAVVREREPGNKERNAAYRDAVEIERAAKPKKTKTLHHYVAPETSRKKHQARKRFVSAADRARRVVPRGWLGGNKNPVSP